ncbi:Glycine/D-amino acid oxidase [Oceanospirillum multiglobuliferum]|uniref:FAD-dependent oxidoreductase n=1 Tax=Oceanospirillum multiglobuliferum TaxID=64969 RepID=A0A1T4PKA9_9GAMM|nr:FAD-dependent oxidoreductase [Oceanospirillum multiglobuliferum]OPX55531.1 FAD-dependent oxidoreductase [Oceanospirillum multiglobuliferum]SJZ91328.1 Glycine/D-amino acid oxidase [Oceanospirillum multiglobuliferum]
MGLSGNHNQAEICVIGGGVVGLSVALGLIRNGHQVCVLDESDLAFRASRGNFGLVWVQGKGDSLAQYAQISRRSARLWQPLAKRLQADTGIDIQLQQKGGLFFCLTEAELQARKQMLSQMQVAVGGDYPFEVLDLQQLRELEPEAGPEVAGATWFPEDGHLNPLLFFRALTDSFLKQGGQIIHSGTVSDIRALTQGFQIQTSQNGLWQCQKVVLCAGLGNQILAPMLGLNAPVVPNRGQVLISERVKPFLTYPTGHVRQTGEGTVQIGDSKEDVGFDSGTRIEVMAKIANRARKMYPILNRVRLVRAWGALRVMTPDGYPIYQQSEVHRNAYLVTCHSGITLGALHEGPIADWISQGSTDLPLEVFNDQRFKL